MLTLEQIRENLVNQLNLDETNSRLLEDAIQLVEEVLDETTDSKADLERLEQLSDSIIMQASGEDENVEAVYNSVKSIIVYMSDLANPETNSNLGALNSEAGVHADLIVNLLRDVLDDYTSTQNYNELLSSGSEIAQYVLHMINSPTMPTILAYTPLILKELADIIKVSADVANDTLDVFNGFQNNVLLYVQNTQNEFEANFAAFEARNEKIQEQGGNWLDVAFSTAKSWFDLVGDNFQDAIDADNIPNNQEVVVDVDDATEEEVVLEEEPVMTTNMEEEVANDANLAHDEL